MMWMKWILWVLILGVVVSIIIAIVGWIQSSATSINAMFGGGVISALFLHATVTLLQVLKNSVMKKT